MAAPRPHSRAPAGQAAGLVRQGARGSARRRVLALTGLILGAGLLEGDPVRAFEVGADSGSRAIGAPARPSAQGAAGGNAAESSSGRSRAAASVPKGSARPASRADAGDAATRAEERAPVRTWCPQELRLVGSVVNASQPERSLAAINIHGGTRMMRTGERIGELTLVALRRSRALFRDGAGRECVLRVTPDGASAPAAKRAPARRPPAAPGKAPAARPKELFSQAELQSGIRRVDATTFVVSRALLDKALGNLTAMRRGARFGAKIEDGRMAGLELRSLRKNAALTHLGLQKGDVIQQINGQPLRSADGQLRALRDLKNGSRFTITLQRGGASRTLTYLAN